MKRTSQQQAASTSKASTLDATVALPTVYDQIVTEFLECATNDGSIPRAVVDRLRVALDEGSLKSDAVIDAITAGDEEID